MVKDPFRHIEVSLIGVKVIAQFRSGRAPGREIDLGKSDVFRVGIAVKMRRIMTVVGMPDRMAENLVRFIHLNEGTLSRKRREGEFEKRTDDEVTS